MWKKSLCLLSVCIAVSLFSTAQSMSQEKKDGIPEAFHGFWSMIAPHRLEHEYDCTKEEGWHISELFMSYDPEGGCDFISMEKYEESQNTMITFGCSIEESPIEFVVKDFSLHETPFGKLLVISVYGANGDRYTNIHQYCEAKTRR